MDTDHTNSKHRHCEERSDVAISCYGSSFTIEIATLPSVARDDDVLRQSLSFGGGLSINSQSSPNPPKAGECHTCIKAIQRQPDAFNTQFF